MIRTLLVLALLTGCSTVGKVALSTLTSKVPSVEAQIGKENNKTLVLGTSEQIKGDKVEKVVEASKVDTVNIQQTPLWMIVLLVLGWLLPSPNEIANWFRNLFKRK